MSQLKDTGKFTLMIQALRGKFYKIKDVSGSTKISTVKARFMEELGDQAAADEYKGKLSKWNENKGKIELKHQGRNMSDKMTLGEYGIVNCVHLPLIVCFRVVGGGGGVPGPNLKNELQQNNWSNDAPKYRVCVAGLNIEFRHNGKNVVGQVGYTTDKNMFRKGLFEAHRGKHIKMAYCPHFNVYCPNHDSIIRYRFNRCKVVFEGELTNGDEVYETKIFGNKDSYYKGDPARYANLEMTVTPN